MARVSASFQLQTITGQRLTVGDVSVIPVSQSLTVRLPFGGFVWNRPARVLVERNGMVKAIPIVDVTRIVQLGLLGLILIIALAARTGSSRRKEQSL